MRVRARAVLVVGVVLAVAAGATALTSTAKATTVACGSTVTSNLALTHGLLGCAGDGLVIGADAITVDLGGHTVAGSVADDSVGIRNAGHASVVVKNGVVRRFERGVRLAGANGNRLRGLTFVQNASDGIDLDHANGNQIVGGTLGDNFTGILLEGGSTGNLVAKAVLKATAVPASWATTSTPGRPSSDRRSRRSSTPSAPSAPPTSPSWTPSHRTVGIAAASPPSAARRASASLTETQAGHDSAHLRQLEQTIATGGP